VTQAGTEMSKKKRYTFHISLTFSNRTCSWEGLGGLKNKCFLGVDRKWRSALQDVCARQMLIRMQIKILTEKHGYLHYLEPSPPHHIAQVCLGYRLIFLIFFMGVSNCL
jgi:hypothetical protein